MVQGVQVNACRNPRCANFGVLPLARVDRGPNPKVVDNYIAVGSGKNTAGLRCKLCNETNAMKSNRAVVEELERISQAPAQVSSIACRTETCAHRGLGDTSPATRYQSFGSTAAGSKRFRCKACAKTFTVPVRSSLRQRLPGKTAIIYRLLINKSPMRRICEVAEVTAPVIYQRIGFIHEQCLRVAAAHDERLRLLDKNRLGIAVDRQEHVLNWSSQFDRRVTQMGAVASTDTTSGFVLGLHLDYDPRYDVHDLEMAAQACGDPAKRPAFRKYARAFLPFEQGPNQAEDPLPEESRLPSRGVRIHSPYTIYAHFFYLRQLLPEVQQLHFYLDRDPGLHGGCFAAFGPRVREGTVEAFWVKIDKSLTVDQKKRLLAASEAALVKAQAAHPGMRKFEVAKQLLLSVLNHPELLDLPVLKRWVPHPMPNMGEPAKAMCYLSDRGDLDPVTLADYLLDVKMHALDRFFMQVRRRLSVLERPIFSPSSNTRWHGYAVYNPTVVMRLLEIFRVTYNFALVGEDRKTPAMRLGLASRPMTLEDIIAFLPGSQSSAKA